MSIYNPFMPATSFLSRATLGGGGGDGGGGDSGGGGPFGLPASQNPPAKVDVPSNDPKEALKVAEDLNKQYANQADVNYARGYNPNTGEVSVVNIGNQSEDRPEPAPVASAPSPVTPAVRPELPTTVEPAPVEPTPTPVAPPPVAPTPYTPPPPPALPDRIPETTLEDAIIADVIKPTYGDKGPQGPMGDKGDKGLMGEVGDKGATGAIGEVGDKGATGTKGLMGRPGERGQAGRPGTPGAAGTYSTPLQTAGMSAVPDQIITRPNYTGTTMANITLPSQGQESVGNVMYGNDLGQTILITEINGQPATYVPPGFRRMSGQTQTPPVAGFNEGGSVEEQRGVDAMYSMATKFLGYRGPKTRKGLEEFAKSSPGAASKMRAYLSGMAKGGLVSEAAVKGYQVGGVVPTNMEALTPDQLANRTTNERNLFLAQRAGNTFDDQVAQLVDPVPKYMVGQKQVQAEIDQEFFNSPEYQDFQNNGPTVGTQDMYNSRFFGGMTSGSIGRAQDQAYINYLKRTNPNSPQIPQVPNAAQPIDPSALLGDRFRLLDSDKAGMPEPAQSGPTYGRQPLVQAPAPGQLTETQLADMSGNLMAQTFQPVQAPVAMIRPEAQDFVAPTAGQTVPQAPMAEVATTGTVEQARAPQVMTPASIQAVVAAPQVAEETARLQAAQGEVSPQAQVAAAQQVGTSVSGVEAAQGTAILMDNPVQRQIQDGELITGVADAATAAKFTEQIQAATATPTKQATVQGQLETLMTQFEGGATPAWAAGAMRAATATMAARGLGASSLAGQAIIQATMESALPIAAADAQTVAQFEMQNLSNRQQRAMLAAQQRAAFIGQEFDQAFQARVANASRIADVANMNFTAEQQVALENSRIANTTNLQNLNNRQAKVMAEAAALANLDISNLNNRQQAAVQNAQNFLQMDLTNLNNEQQTGLFRAQQNIQALFTDQAAQNAALQFNAASENQTNQFFSNLDAQVSQFNATQKNAMDQFNVNSVNAMRQFNSEVQQQRDLFNAQNGLVVAQANAQWRQNIATLNTAAMNQSNMDFAKTVNALTSTNLDQIWQRERDIMSYSFTASETAKDRALNILLADKDLAAYREKMAADESNAMWAVGAKLLFGI